MKFETAAAVVFFVLLFFGAKYYTQPFPFFHNWLALICTLSSINVPDKWLSTRNSVL